MSGSNFDGGFNTLISDDDSQNEEQPTAPRTNSNQSKREVSIPKITAERLPAVSLAVLAAVLLIVDISLGAHYNKLRGRPLQTADTERIQGEIQAVQSSYNATIARIEEAHAQMSSVMSHQEETNWELEHQIKREAEYKVLTEKLTEHINALREYVQMMNGGCKKCPAGWILVSSMCYYSSHVDSAGYKTWQAARDYCKIYGGDLPIIDSKEKEKATVRFLINHLDPSERTNSFWIGLKDLEEEGSWRWWDGKYLAEGFWADGEPNDLGGEDCAAVYPIQNYFKAWNDVRCSSKMNWLCEKTPTP